MNLVEQIARMVDAEVAYGVWYDSAKPDAGPVPPTMRQKYFRAHYECKAIEVLKLLAGTPATKIKADLIEFEKKGWRQLGVPIDDPKLKRYADRIIEQKYA